MRSRILKHPELQYPILNFIGDLGAFEILINSLFIIFKPGNYYLIF